MQTEGELISKLHNMSTVNKTALEKMNDLRAHYDYSVGKITQQNQIIDHQYMYVTVSGIYSMVNGNHAHNNYYQWPG